MSEVRVFPAAAVHARDISIGLLHIAVVPSETAD